MDNGGQEMLDELYPGMVDPECLNDYDITLKIPIEVSKTESKYLYLNVSFYIFYLLIEIKKEMTIEEAEEVRK